MSDVVTLGQGLQFDFKASLIVWVRSKVELGAVSGVGILLYRQFKL